MSIEEQVERALSELVESIQVRGPFPTATHTCYVVTGLSDTPEQTENLCWCLLGFLGRIYEIDLQIDSAIGYGTQAQKNLMDALKKRLDIDRELTERQKERKRDPLLQELIAHTLVLVHQRQDKFPEWLGEILALRPPHLSPNAPGLDLIAVGIDGVLFPAIGEVKAYAEDPVDGFCTACHKFTQIRQGEYNDEIREAIKAMDCGFTKQQLADNIWVSTGRFGAIVGHDVDHSFNEREPVQVESVVSQPKDRLFFITSPFQSMRGYFDALVEVLEVLAKQLGEQNNAG